MNQATVTLVHETCWCGMPFMLPQSLDNAARNSGHTIYCPLGHAIVWKQTEADKLRLERDRLKQEQARLQDEISDQKRRANDAMERAVKAEATSRKLKKRAAAGTCPCCQRTFSNMSTHIRHKHPEYVAENVVKLKTGTNP